MSEKITRESLSALHGKSFTETKRVAARMEAEAPAERPLFRRSSDVPREPEVEVTRLTRPSHANRYPGTCPECGQGVRAGEGTATREGSRWVTRHKGGACPMVTVSSLPRIQAGNGQVYSGPILPGIYTMEDNQGGHATYRVRVQGSEEEFAPGETIIEFLSGPDNTHDYTAFGFLKNGSLVVWKRFREDSFKYQVGGALAFLREPQRATVARTCIRCNAVLTTPESIALGLGPTCAQKGW